TFSAANLLEWQHHSNGMRSAVHRPYRIRCMKALTVLAASVMMTAIAQPTVSHLPIPRDPNATMNVIVRYRAGASETKVAEMIGSAVRHNHDLSLLRAHAITIRAGDLGALASSPDVEEIYPDNPVAASAFSGTIDYGRMAVLGLTSSTQTFPYDGTG